MFGYSDPTVALTPAVSELQVDGVEMGCVIDGIHYFFRGNILVKLVEDYDSYLVEAAGTFYVGEDDEDGVEIYWDETDTECFRILEQTYEKDDIIKDVVAHKARYE